MSSKHEFSKASRIIVEALAGDTAPVDVAGIALKLPGGWPFVFVELGLGGAEELTLVGGKLIGLDIFPALLERAGLRPTRDLLEPPEPAEGVTFIARRPGRGKPSGIFGPGTDGAPNAWTLISPMPPWPVEFDVILPAYGWQLGVYLTAKTTGLCRLNNENLIEALRNEGEAGRLYAGRAAVV